MVEKKKIKSFSRRKFLSLEGNLTSFCALFGLLPAEKIIGEIKQHIRSVVIKEQHSAAFMILAARNVSCNFNIWETYLCVVLHLN